MTTHIHDNITSLKNEITEYTREVWEKGVLTLQPRRRSLTIQALKVPGPGPELPAPTVPQTLQVGRRSSTTYRPEKGAYS